MYVVARYESERWIKNSENYEKLQKIAQRMGETVHDGERVGYAQLNCTRLREFSARMRKITRNYAKPREFV